MRLTHCVLGFVFAILWSLTTAKSYQKSFGKKAVPQIDGQITNTMAKISLKCNLEFPRFSRRRSLKPASKPHDRPGTPQDPPKNPKGSPSDYPRDSKGPPTPEESHLKQPKIVPEGLIPRQAHCSKRKSKRHPTATNLHFENKTMQAPSRQQPHRHNSQAILPRKISRPL